MRDVLLSVKPKYVDKILAVSKLWEFRKKIWKCPVNYVYIYSSAPVQKIVGRFRVDCVLGERWNLLFNHCVSIDGGTARHLGISFAELREYFGGQGGFAVRIKDLEVFKVHVDPVWVDGVPQNFRYLSEAESALLDGFMLDSKLLEGVE